MSGVSPAAPARVRPLFRRAGRARGKSRPLATTPRARLLPLFSALCAQPTQPEPPRELLAPAPALLAPIHVAAGAERFLRIIAAASLREAIPVAGGRQALEQMGQAASDQAITDMAMPGVDGFEALREAFQNEPRGMAGSIFCASPPPGPRCSAPSVVRGTGERESFPQGDHHE